MTVYEFRKMCDTSETSVQYIVMREEKDETLEYFYCEKVWVSDDWGYDDNDELQASIVLNQKQIDDAEIISIKIEQFMTRIKVRL